MRTALLLVHAAVTLFLVGVIWMVQVVHYPLFGLVGAGSFAAYGASHGTRMGLLLAVPWALQGATGLALLAARPAAVPLWLGPGRPRPRRGDGGDHAVRLRPPARTPRRRLRPHRPPHPRHQQLAAHPGLTASGGTVLAMLALVIAKP